MDIESLEALLRAYKEISEQIRQLERQKAEMSRALLNSFPTELKKYSTPQFRVFRQKRLNIKTTLEEARLYNAVKLQEVVDKDRLRSLCLLGEEIPGISYSEYVLVNPIAKNCLNRSEKD